MGGGPLVAGTSRNPLPRPDGSAPLVVSAVVVPGTQPLAGVTLLLAAGWGPEARLAMAADAASPPASLAPGQPGGVVYRATLPASVVAPGALVRWAVLATDAAGGATRDPPGPPAGGGKKAAEARRYYGTVVADPSDPASLPVMEMYCPVRLARRLCV